MNKSDIEWTDTTWNPVRGCSLVSAGCEHCYAMKQAHRMSHPGGAYEGLTEIGPNGVRWNGKIKLVESELAKPLRMKKPQKIFVNSMSDLFHPDVPFEFIDKVMAVIALCPQHTFIVLTKRPERMAEYFNDNSTVRSTTRGDSLISYWKKFPPKGIAAICLEHYTFPLPNLWLGVSVEDQKTADARIPKLLATPAAVRFVSYEPALGPVDFAEIYSGITRESVLAPECWGDCNCDGLYGFDPGCRYNGGDGALTRKLDWIIMGGESGPGARPMHPDWAQDVRDQCKDAGVPFFFKQWGEWVPMCDAIARGFRPIKSRTPWHYLFDTEPSSPMWCVGKKRAGCLLDGVLHNEFPEVT